MARKTELERLNEIIVDPEFSGMCNNLTDEEFENLRQNILNDGEVLDPLLLWHGILIDGHHRLKILKEHPDISYRTHEMIFVDREEVLLWIADHQLGRRNLTAFQKTQLALKKEAIIARKAKENQKAAGGAVPQKSAEAVDTRKEIAKIAGVSTDTVSKVKKILECGNPQLIESARSGKVSINKAYQDIKTDAKANEIAQDDSSSVTLRITKEQMKTLGFFEKELHLRNSNDVLQFMLDYFGKIHKEASETEYIDDETIDDFIPAPSPGALSNFLNSFNTTEALANEINMETYAFSDFLWHHIFDVPDLRATAKQKEKLLSTLKESLSHITTCIDNLDRHYL